MVDYNREKDNLNVFIHPLIVALFLIRIPAIERRMLFTNIGRFVVQRSLLYFQRMDDKKMNAKYMNWHLSLNDLLPAELQADLDFMYDIAKDPNSLDHFSDESPMSNLLKRFTIQIELWKNVLALRQGKYYSRSLDYTDDQGIMGLHKVLSSYQWTYFDSPDLYHVNDEGNLLRRLLAVFSFRPTLTQLSSFAQRGLLGYSNLPAISRATFVNTPICNIRLPVSVIGTPNMQFQTVNLQSSLSKSELYIENKMLVPKNTSVIFSKSVMFFYINRRYQSPLMNSDMGFRYLSVPGTVSGMTSINTTTVDVVDELIVGNDRFELSSVVVLNQLLEGTLATGCSSIVIVRDGITRRRRYYYYNPLSAGIMYEEKDEHGNAKYVRNSPVSALREFSAYPDMPSFHELAEKYGTILVYANPADNNINGINY